MIPIIITPRIELPDQSALASIDTAFIVGDTLRLRISHAGCGPGHEFGLAVQRNLLDSTPPHAVLVLRHHSNGDCRAGFTYLVDADLLRLQPLVQSGRALRLRLHEPRSTTPFEPLLDYNF